MSPEAQETISYLHKKIISQDNLSLCSVGIPAKYQTEPEPELCRDHLPK